MNLSFQSINRQLSAVCPDYQERIEKEDRQKVDWELCASGLISEVELLHAYSAASGVPIIEENDIKPVNIVPEIPLDYCNSWCVLPVYNKDGRILLLLADPYTMDRHRYMLYKLLGKRVLCGLIKRSTLERLIVDCGNIGSEAETPHIEGSLNPEEDEEALRSLASEAKIVRLVNEMLVSAVEMNASDIHVEPEEDRTVIRFRVDGMLREYTNLPLSRQPAIASRIKLLGGLNIAESRLPQDGRTNIQLARANIDIRISTMPTINGESIVLRLLRKGSVSFNLSEIGMLPDMQETFEKLIHIPYGMILVVGPTGSGKTTTLYSVISRLNNTSRKIITIEDPVEYRMEQLQQIQVNPKIGLTFANGLRHIVRQDPDIILVGEIRDRETADIAVNAALTGHLVLSTLHTNDAAGAINRLLDMGMEGFLVSSVLYGVLSQRLVRRICPDCHGTGKGMAGAKCPRCGGWRYSGRTGIFELLEVTPDIRDAINRNASSSEIAEIAVKNGMKLLVSDGMDKVKLGITTEEEVRLSAIDF